MDVLAIGLLKVLKSLSLGMLTKEKLIFAINRLPDNFSFDDVLNELLLIQKVEIGLKQSGENDVISDDDLDNELPEWLS
jgi:hypothetical protein